MFFKNMFPTRNLVWFPSFRLIILVLITLIIETGILILYCLWQNYTVSEIENLSLIVILANLVTGFVGWIFAFIRG